MKNRIIPIIRSSNLTTTITSTRTKSTSVRFRRIDVTPDPILNITPSPRSSHGLSALSCGTRLVLYGGEVTPMTPVADRTHQALWLAERTSTKSASRPSTVWKYPFDHPTENDRWQWKSIPHHSSSTSATDDTITAAVPPPRVGHSQASVGNITYVMGGIGTNQQTLNDMWKLEIIRDDDDDDELIAKWTQVQTTKSNDSNAVVPMPRSHHRMITINNSLYLFGGCGGSTAADDKHDSDNDQRQYRLNDLWKFDTIHETWTPLGKSHLLSGGAGPAMLSLNKTPGNYDSRIAVFAAAVEGEGGDHHNNNNNNNNEESTIVDGHIYSASTASWELNGLSSDDDDILCNNKLSKRSASCFGSFPKLNRCLIFGGEVDSSSFENDIVILDGTSGTILDVLSGPTSQLELDVGLVEDYMPSWPEARGYADGCVGMDGETMYIFGGLTAEDDNINGAPKRLNDLWECKVVVND